MDCAHCNSHATHFMASEPSVCDPPQKMCPREAESRLPSFAGQDLAGHVMPRPVSDALGLSHLKHPETFQLLTKLE